ncbi:MAG: SUMF1/EgtB/PvdO family nonheme iron enzyme, partial [Chloroflexota bacterium]
REIEYRSRSSVNDVDEGPELYSISRSTDTPQIDFVSILSGIVRLVGESDALPKSVSVKAFDMAKYPVVNADFQRFVMAPDGYANPSWWQYSDRSCHWFEEHPLAVSSCFPDERTPRENVSWYAAVAFCLWLGHRLGRRVQLPTFSHWFRAAQGDDGRLFPWGDQFESDRCNTRESRFRRTTPVDCYRDGISPYGVFDMAGNVWEWCSDGSRTEDILSGEMVRKRAVVGGSYLSPLERSQVGYRCFLHPNTVAGSIGFRVICVD